MDKLCFLTIRPFQRITALVLILLLFLLSGCSQENSVKTVRVQKAVKAGTIRVEAKAVPVIRTFPGEVRAKVSITLASRMAANVQDVTVEMGDQVKPGMLLVQMDDRELQARIDSLISSRAALSRRMDTIRARLEYAKLTFERFHRLYAEEAATRDELDRARTQLQAKEAEIQAARADLKAIDAQIREIRHQLNYTMIKSPIAGWVSYRMVDPGTFVNPGQPVISIDGRDHGFWFVADVDETLLSHLKKGDKVAVSIPAAGLDIMAPIAHIRPGSSKGTHTVTLYMDISGFHVKTGLFGRLSLTLDTDSTVLLPVSAILDRGGIKGVFVVDKSNLVHWRVIRTGKMWKEEDGLLVPIFSEDFDNGKPELQQQQILVSITSGLHPGERVAVSNLAQLREGVTIE